MKGIKESQMWIRNEVGNQEQTGIAIIEINDVNADGRV